MQALGFLYGTLGCRKKKRDGGAAYCVPVTVPSQMPKGIGREKVHGSSYNLDSPLGISCFLPF